MGTVRAELALPTGEPRAVPARRGARRRGGRSRAGGRAAAGQVTSELSGGELQRVALAASLAGRPELLVLDEPTSQLDPVAGDELIGTLRRINEDRDTAILLAEHRLERCLGWADRVLALEGGRIVCDAPPERIPEMGDRRMPPIWRRRGLGCSMGSGWRRCAGVKAARQALRSQGLLRRPSSRQKTASRRTRARTRARAKSRTDDALRFDGVWHELRNGPAILRGVSLRVARARGWL